MGTNAKSFYGGSTKKEFLRHARLLERTKRRAEDLKKVCVPLPISSRQCFRFRWSWKWFPRQAEAVAFVDGSKDKSLRLFSFEKNEGKRKFLVTSTRGFWDRYRSLDAGARCFYEIVRDSPCRLYFDVEFDFSLNPDLDAHGVLDTFVQFMIHSLRREYGITCKRSDVVDMDSSTESKFSRHLIFHLGDCLFVNNIHCGNFVKSVCFSLKAFVNTGVLNQYVTDELLRNNGTSLEDLEKIIVNGKDGKKLFLCDLGVYSKNRNFRLFKSKKQTKHVCLEIARENEYAFKKFLSTSEARVFKMWNETFDPEYQTFLDTLICPQTEVWQDVPSTLLSYGDNACDFGVASKKGCRSAASLKPVQEGYASSPFPALDRFILAEVERRGGPGSIRRWLFYESALKLVFDIDGNRWCASIGRHHKSNHIYFVVDLQHGVVYQKCHDPDCQATNFRSGDIALPVECNPFLDHGELDVCVEDGQIVPKESVAPGPLAPCDLGPHHTQDSLSSLVRTNNVDNVLDSHFESDVGLELENFISGICATRASERYDEVSEVYGQAASMASLDSSAPRQELEVLTARVSEDDAGSIDLNDSLKDCIDQLDSVKSERLDALSTCGNRQLNVVCHVDDVDHNNYHNYDSRDLVRGFLAGEIQETLDCINVEEFLDETIAILDSPFGKTIS